ncbi:MAG: DUF4339 domain-containing protein [Candidatus Accumulibacter sp. UW25]|jgi:hypothetical protein
MMNDDNFFSINRLVEFGLGVGVAQQMVKSMNHALNNTQIPGSQTNPISLPAKIYHVVFEGNPAGPFNENEISSLIAVGKLKKDTFVWRPGMPKWEVVANVPDILKLVALAPPPFIPPKDNDESTSR